MEEWRKGIRERMQKDYNKMVANYIEIGLCDFITQDFRSKILFKNILGVGAQGSVYEFNQVAPS